MQKRNLRTFLLDLSSKTLTQRQWMLLLSMIVGLLSGLAAVMLKTTVHYIHELLISRFNVTSGNPEFIIYPAIGIVLTVLFVKYVVRDDIGHGVSKILHAISRGRGRLRAHNMWSSMVSSTLTVSFGGSVGLEAPIVITGSSIGSNIGRYFRLNRRDMILLIGCGAAGAVSGIFKAPIAGVVFALEILMLDLTMASLVPLLIAAVTAAVLDMLLMGENVLFSYEQASPFLIREIPWYILLGAFTGMVSVYFSRTSLMVETWFAKIGKPYLRVAFGSALLGLFIFFFPPIFGEGYSSLKLILNGLSAALTNNSLFYQVRYHEVWFPVFLLLVLIFKVFAMSATLGSGGIGGIFAPSLFMGGVSGLFVSRILNQTGYLHLNESSFALAGMAGTMAGIMHAPLTAIFLIAEISNGYELFIPLIITATISFVTINYFEPHSVYAKRLAEKGELITHDKDRSALGLMKIDRLIETNFLTVAPHQTLGELVQVIEKSERNVFPVVDNDNHFHGVVFLNDIRHIIFKRELYDTVFVSDLMFMPDVLVEITETVEQVAQKFHSCHHYNLPVLDRGRYVGFVSRANLFSAYRRIVQEFSDE